MKYFVDENSIVREIWGKGDTILFIFAGASAEFALNKAVDWLYFTGRLPKDPLGRLFSTVSYAREIVFAEKHAALKAIDRINSIHASVEAEREKSIPDWAYRDVLFMLIDYSIRSFEILERKLKLSEKTEVFYVFWRVGKRMNLKGLPENFEEFEAMRQSHLEEDLIYGAYTKNLYKQYRKHLGLVRYRLLLETQSLITPLRVRRYLNLRNFSFLKPVLPAYKISRSIKLDGLLKSLILPSEYKAEIKSLDMKSA
ncbi:hypothetical protein APR41_14110 [Salegentibacter salinarum]|uniref:ER-bound oxygenase mpaB/mpaB'/Rubber oxygenase catalytic domain-containing protein n=1 Tax=Salegentibacter salinarum TaxID=447422 RepID=A0A2N0U096_9FLAO|nr:oxygenase MpaB family protein [Salegentibacter salinarum]PKD20407.1 hypothetical protein APR41_14110 [Salegentibacter salinarum]SKB85114.1 hypothetical protein SAMN05660903_02869 [Salegentibacter salinarum]